MAAEVALGEIEDCVRRLQGTVTPEDIQHSNRLKKRIMERPHNIYLLISFLEQGLEDSVAMLVTQYIDRMINAYKTNFPLMEILNKLMEVSVSDSVVGSLALCIRDIANILYCALPPDQKRFVLEVPSEPVISLLSDCVFSSFLESFEDVVAALENSRPRRLVMFEEFRVMYAVDIVKWAIACIGNTPMRAMHLIVGCMTLGQDEESSGTVTSSGFLNLLQFVAAPEFFQWLYEVAMSGEWPESDQAWRAVTMIARGINEWRSETHVFVPLIQTFVVSVLENKETLVVDVDRKCVRFQNLLLAINPVSRQTPYHDMINKLFEFMLELLGKCDRSMVVMLPGLLNIMKRHMMSYSRDKSSDLGAELQGRLATVLRMFIENTVNVCASDPRVILEGMLENIDETYESLKRLWELCNLSLDEARAVADMVCDNMQKGLEAPFGEVNCCVLAVVELVMKVAIDKRFVCMDQSVINRLIDGMFWTIPKTEEPIKQVQSKEFVSALESVQLDLLQTFVDQFFGDLKQRNSDDFGQRKQELTVLSDEKDVVSFLIRHLFENLLQEIQVDQTSQHIVKLLDGKKLMSIISETEVPEQLLESWMKLRSCPAVYAMIVRILFQSSEDIEKEGFRGRFLQSFIATFQVPLKEDLVERCFDFIANLFATSKDWYAWSDLCELLLDKYGDPAVEVAQSEHSEYILNFLTVLTSHPIFSGTKENRTNVLLDTKTKYPFGLFRLLVTLTKHCTMKLVEKLRGKPVVVNEAIFTCILSVSDTYQEGSTVVDEINDENWEELSRVCEIAQLILDSPFCNFGILELFNDRCVDELIDGLIECAFLTSSISWVSVNGLCGRMLKLVRCFTDARKPDFFIANEQRRKFLCTVTKVAFLSSSEEVRDNACIVLRDTLVYSRQSDIASLFLQHFVLALNLSLDTQAEACDKFLYRFLCRCDRSAIAAQVINPIKAELVIPESQRAFSRGWDELFTDHVVGPETQAVVENGVPRLIPVTEEQRFAVLSDTDDGEMIFVDRMKQFKEQLGPYCVQLDYIPSLGSFFVFGN